MAQFLPQPEPPLKASAPRVLIVDDSAVARAALSRFVAAGGRFAVAAALPDAQAALAFLADCRVDLIVLDLEMPHTSGIDALPALLEAGRGARVLIVSSAAAEGAAVTMRALALGAADTLVKPGTGAFASRFGVVLQERLALLAASETAPASPGIVPVIPDLTFDAIAIGASTGGIHALASLLETIPAEVDQPIFITQHLPPSFSPFFAEQVGVSARRAALIGTDRRRVSRGEVMIAPGDAHLVVGALSNGRIATRLSRMATATGNLPSVDPMFASLAQVYGARLLAVVLSGMGRDGLEGARAVHDAGGTVVVQDQASSVVWGMPGVVAREGIARAVLPPAAIGAMIAATVRHGA